MLTIRQALQLPIFSSAILVAGRDGVDNEISWVHIVDIPDATYEWRRPNILLLTAGFGLRDDPERQAALIPKLIEEQFAGLVLSTGFYFDETPAGIRRAADENKFPVIETPRELMFVDVTASILEQIVNENYALLRRSQRIHERLTTLVLQGGGFDELAETLAALLQRSITIEDTAFRVLATAQHGRVDSARERSVANGRTTPKLARHLLDAGIYDRLLQEMEPVHIPPMPDLDMNMERFVAPIIVEREIHGYIWIIAGAHPLTELDKLALDHGATVAALIFFKEQAVRKATEALRGDFLEQLLQNETKTAAFSEQAHRLNYHPERPHQVLLIHGLPAAGGDAYALYADVETQLHSRGVRPLLAPRDEHLVAVIESGGDAKGKEIAQTLVQDVAHPTYQLRIGVGRAISNAKTLRRSYEEAEEALRVGEAMQLEEPVIAFTDLGLLHWLYHLPPETIENNAYLQHIRTLAQYDRERNAELVKTLETFLDHGSAMVDAAQALYIHRNTLLHRLERIEKLCQITLREPLHQLNLHAAIKSYRLYGMPSDDNAA
jgi:purine catabolism regulator